MIFIILTASRTFCKADRMSNVKYQHKYGEKLHSVRVSSARSWALFVQPAATPGRHPARHCLSMRNVVLRQSVAVRTSLGMSGPKLGHFVPLKFCSLADSEEEVRREMTGTT